MKKLPFIRWLANGTWLLLAPACLLIPASSGFLYPRAAGSFSDIAISHYPNAVYLLRSLQEWHTLPFWSPTILSGYPFAANPLAGMWYPPGWIALLFPLPFGFNLTAVLHLLWGGYGMYRILRLEGLSKLPALFGGLAFEAMPKIFAHLGAGHLSLIYAVCWTPWLFYSQAQTRRTIRLRGEVYSASLKSAVFSIERVMPGVVLGLICLADIRWAGMLGLVWLITSLFSVYQTGRGVGGWAPDKISVLKSYGSGVHRRFAGSSSACAIIGIQSAFHTGCDDACGFHEFFIAACTSAWAARTRPAG